MSKVKRNESCPCGSGKKYKKCCGTSNLIKFDPQIINDELNLLHQQFISFATDNHADKIKKKTELYSNPFLKDQDELKDIYNTGLTIWILLNVPFFYNNQTLFDNFYSSRESIINRQSRTIFSKWTYKVPSIYEVQSIDHKKNIITLNNLLTNETFPISVLEGEEFIEESFIIGTIVPFYNQHNFLFSMIKLYHHNRSDLNQLLQKYSKKDDGLARYFPDLLADVLSFKAYHNKMYETVAQLFASHMTNKGYHDDIILEGVNLWNQFTEKENLSIKKAEPYAAALEYLVQKTILNSSNITQSQLANEYVTTSASVSANFRKLSNVLTSNKTIN